MGEGRIREYERVEKTGDGKAEDGQDKGRQRGERRGVERVVSSTR